MRVITYDWRIYTGQCNMVGYFTDPDHNPTQWQESITDEEDKQKAIEIVNRDRQEAESTNQFRQSAINADVGIYQRRTDIGNRSCWEVKLDEQGEVLPNPCEEKPAGLDLVLRLAAVSLRQDGTRVILTVVGERLNE